MLDQIFKAYDASGSMLELANQPGDTMVGFEKDGGSRSAFSKLVTSSRQTEKKNFAGCMPEILRGTRYKNTGT